MRKLLVSTCIIALSGCSLLFDRAPEAEIDLSPVSYQLYLSRSSLESTAFEQYKLLPTGLFFECGSIYRGRSDTKDQGIRQIDPEVLRATQQAAFKILEHMKRDSPPAVDVPGTNAGLADPGKFLLTLRSGDATAEVKTSLDYVERDQTIIARDAKRFAQLLRSSLAQPPCGNWDFYGIGRR